MLDPVEVAVLLPGALVAVALTALAVVVLRARPDDTANRSFAIFLFLVAANYLLVGASDVLGRGDGLVAKPRPALSAALLVLAYLVQVFDPVALAVFAGRYAGGWLASRGARGGALALAVALASYILLDPASVVETRGTGRDVVNLYVTTAYLAVFAALAAREFGRPEDAPPRFPRGFLLGWAAVVFFRIAPGFDVAALVEPRREALWVSHLLGTVLVVVATWAALGFAYALLRGAARPRHRGELRRLLLRAGLVAGAFGLVLETGNLGSVALHGGPAPGGSILHVAVSFLQHSTFAIRWFFFAAVVGPAILRNQVFDLDARLRRALLAGTVTGVLLLLFGAAVVLIERELTRDGTLPVATVAVLVLLTLAATQSVRIGRRVGERAFPPERERDEAYLRLRQFEVYRDAAGAVASGRATAEGLERLRVRLGLSPEEAELATSFSAGTVPDLAPGALLAGRYRIVRPIGQGGHGRVVLARDERDARDVAVKEVAPPEGGSALRRIEAEVRAASKLRHPNLLVAREHFAIGGTAYLVTDYVAGGSLADAIRRRGALPAGEAARLAAGILAGLAEAHRHGVLHRDVKPSNVLLEPDGRPRLADFGVALVRDVDVTATSVGAPVPGTLAYLPPEALLGEPVDHRGDLYAVGTLLLEALLGRVVAPADRAPPGTPPALARAVERARDLDPDRRFGSAEEMRALLVPVTSAREP